MNTANILSFLIGSGAATIAFALYARHVEQVHFISMMAARNASFNEGVAVGKLQPFQPLAPTRILKRL